MTKQKKPPDCVKRKWHLYSFHALIFFSKELELILDLRDFIGCSSMVSDILVTSFLLFTLGHGFVPSVGSLPTFSSRRIIFFIPDSPPYCWSSASTFCSEDDNALSAFLPLGSVNQAVTHGDINNCRHFIKIFFVHIAFPDSPRSPSRTMHILLKVNSIPFLLLEDSFMYILCFCPGDHHQIGVHQHYGRRFQKMNTTFLYHQSIIKRIVQKQLKTR